MAGISPLACCAVLAASLGATLASADLAAPATTAATASTPRALAAIQGGCRLFAADADQASSDDCLACHAAGIGTQLNNCHPVELTYPSTPTGRLRPLRDALNRGAFLPNNLLRCVTCHDGDSPWDGAIALPPGATALRGVVAGDATTYSPVAAAPPRPGDRVTPTPLCRECHAME